MRILYLVHQYLPGHIGGTEVYVRGLATRARARGHEPAIVTYCESPSNDTGDFGVRRTRVDDVEVAEIHYNLGVAPRPGRYEYANPFVADRVEEELRHFKPDVVHVAHAMKLSGAALQRCHDCGVPVVVTLCDFWFLCLRHTLLRWDGVVCDGPPSALGCYRCSLATHPKRAFGIFAKRYSAAWAAGRHLLYLFDLARRQRYLRGAMLTARRIVALSPFAKRVFVGNGIPASRIEVLRHGLEPGPQVARPRRPPEDRLEVVYIGSLVYHKGVHVLLEALAQIPSLPLRCKIYGALRDEDAYVQRLREYGHTDSRIEFCGTFPAEQLWEIVSRADLLALPALWYENEPLVVKAALQLGVPVLTSNLGSLPDLVRHGENGWLMIPGDAASMAGVLAELVRHPDKRRIDPVPAVSMDSHADRMFAIYEEATTRA